MLETTTPHQTEICKYCRMPIVDGDCEWECAKIKAEMDAEDAK